MSFQVGSKAPDFALDAVVNGGEFTQVKLADYKGKWVVLFFYPLDFTFVCPTEIVAFQEHLDEFRKVGAEVVGCSVDSKFSHLAWLERPRKEGGIAGVKFPIMADINKSVSRDYGVLVEAAGVALRGVFIIDDEGVIQYAGIHNLGVGRSVEETLRVLKAFQLVKKTGEVCPANWHEGSDTMKPDWNKSKEYFGKASK
jgi:peroxiredoxin (alkyl hydroperoxide reductase subunit C)